MTLGLRTAAGACGSEDGIRKESRLRAEGQKEGGLEREGMGLGAAFVTGHDM
jgi:hypothetical protein